MKALITGIDGFVGNHLSNYLLKEGYEVYGTTIIDDFKKENIDIYHMNVLDKEEVKNVINKNGNNLIQSNNVSTKTSTIHFTLFPH